MANRYNRKETVTYGHAILSMKNKIEKAFLRNRISYFIRWDKVSVWQRIFGKRNAEQCKI